jgi:uncharacterized protein involved in exopolysaccharide biosynthesis
MLNDGTEIQRVDPVTLEPLEKSTTFSIFYSNHDPIIAAKVAEELLGLFLTYNRMTRSENAAENQRFLQNKAVEINTSIRDMEARLADFKAKYADALPGTQQRNADAADRLQRDLDGMEAQLRIAQERESLLELQLSQVSPSLVAAISDRTTELAKLKAQLADAQQRYTPNHPDVKRLQRAVQALVETPAATGPAAAPDNPDYLRIASQLDSARREVAALQASVSRGHQQIARYSESKQLAPNVEREYSDLTRDYELAQQQNREIQGKLRDAALATTLESEQRGERFTLIRAPYPPTSPYFPNRLGIILLGLVLGFGLAFGAIAVIESSDPNVRGMRDLSELTDVPVIGAIPVLLNRDDRRRRMWIWSATSAAFVVAALFVAITVIEAVNHQPHQVESTE